ncbi:MAG: glycerate kinase, partial [Acidobacteriota bacterium]
GALQALGVSIVNKRGQPVGAGGAALSQIAALDISKVDVRLREAEIIIASDVENRLLGAHGAAAVFARQKGATPTMVGKLETGLAHWAEVVAQTTGMETAKMVGSGAAGGLAIGFLALFGAKIRPGSLLVFDHCKLQEKIESSALIFTGEGSLDMQTLAGKTPARLAAAARAAGVPLIAFAARIDVSAQQLKAQGFQAVIPIVDKVLTLTEACQQGPALLQAAATRTMQLMRLGQQTYWKL